MAANLQPPFYSLDEYFAVELNSTLRHEYWDGQIVCMSGGTNEHGRIVANVHGELYAQLKNGSCQARTENTAVKNPLVPRPDWPPYVYPDASVICGPERVEKIRGIAVMANPILVVEVASATSKAIDTGNKLTIYTSIPTLNHYLIIGAEVVDITHWFRRADGTWDVAYCSDINAVIAIDDPAVRLALRDVYAGVI